MHIWIILSGTAHEDNSELKNEVVTPWKTPATTVIDMIHANPFAEEVIKDFFDILPRYDYDLRVALMVTVDKHLSEKDQHDFGTPNLTRVMNFIAKNIHPLKIGREKLDDTRKALNTSGYSFLRNQIGILRPIKTP